MSETITIAGEEVNITPRYFEGHVLTPNEASALNQTYFENVRNNLASTVKAAKETGSFDLAAFQTTVDEYSAAYQFGVRTGGGRSSDPVKQAAMEIAREKVRAAITKAGLKASDYSAKAVSDKAAEVLNRGDATADAIYAAARAQVEASKAIAIDSLDMGAPSEAPAPKAKKAKAEA